MINHNQVVVISLVPESAVLASSDRGLGSRRISIELGNFDDSPPKVIANADEGKIASLTGS
jgi:hypothetical protein